MLFNFGKFDIKDEFTAALTIFLASSYILFLNPQIMSESGMDFDGAFFATGLAAAIGTLLVALIANKPYIIAPGMTLNLFFAAIVRTHNISWQMALAASLFVGVILLALSISKIRVWFVEAIPMGLRYGILGGIGMLLVFFGFMRAHLAIPSNDGGFALVGMGNIFAPETLLAIFGFLITGLLVIKKVRGAFLFGILFTTGIHIISSFYSGNLPAIDIFEFPTNLTAVAFKFDIAGLTNAGALSIVLSLFVVAFFDTIGTSTALLIRGKHTDRKGNIKDLDKVMVSDSLATIIGSAFGASPQALYVESASAYDAGGKTGVTAIFVSIFFALSLFFLPLIKLVPMEATAPVLMIVGLLMLGSMRHIDMRDYSESIPALFCLAAIPLTFSISQGIGLAAIMYVVLKTFSGKFSSVHPGMWITALLFLLDFLEFF